MPQVWIGTTAPRAPLSFLRQTCRQQEQ
ncbi:hypothetical protein G9274_002690 [Stenotrophomonas rhizophila]|nr:hypothetical protein G9274_002690 [Stenotrophomonas rhizophila]